MNHTRTSTPSPVPSLVPFLAAAVLAAALLTASPRAAAGQSNVTIDASTIERALVGTSLGLGTGLVLAGPSGTNVLVGDDFTAVLLGAGTGLAASFLPYPAGTRFRAFFGPAFARMDEMAELYDDIKNGVEDFRAADEPGLAVDWSVQGEVLSGGWGYGGQLGVINDAASVTVNAIFCDTQRCQQEEQLAAQSTAQSLVVAGSVIRRLGGESSAIWVRAAAGGGRGGLSYDDETDVTFAPYAELAVQAGGFIDGGGPTFQVGGRYHQLDDLDYAPIGVGTTGRGSADFTGLFVRFGWTF